MKPHRFVSRSAPFGEPRAWCSCGHYFESVERLEEHCEQANWEEHDARPDEPETEDDGA